LADDLELLEALFEPPFEPPFAPPDFFAAVAMLMVLEAPVILERGDDRIAPLNRNLIHRRRPNLFRGFFEHAAEELGRRSRATSSSRPSLLPLTAR
jgi:hypothetical protein